MRLLKKALYIIPALLAGMILSGSSIDSSSSFSTNQIFNAIYDSASKSIDVNVSSQTFFDAVGCTDTPQTFSFGFTAKHMDFLNVGSNGVYIEEDGTPATQSDIPVDAPGGFSASFHMDVAAASISCVTAPAKPTTLRIFARN